MGKRGPVGRSTADLKLHGTFRKDLHADRAASEVVVPPGMPAKPEGLDAVASHHWDEIIKHIGAVGIVGQIDGTAIERAARYLALEKRMLTLCETDPSDEASAKLAIKYGRIWMESAVSLGLTPAARSRMRMPPKEEKPKGVVSRARA